MVERNSGREGSHEEMLKKLRDLFEDERGQDLMEYGLLAAFISIAALAVIKLIGPLIAPLYEAVRTLLTQ